MSSHHVLGAVALLMAAVAGPVAGQAHTTALGLDVGASIPADLTRGTGQPTVLEPGWTAGAQIERWWGSRWAGTRAHVTYAERPLRDDGSVYQVFSGEISLVSRLVAPLPERRAAPFATIGAGVVVHRGLHGAPPLGGGLLGGDPMIHPAITVSIGADLFAASRLGLRVEFLDQVVVPAITSSGGGGQAHNLEARAGLQLRLGRTPPLAVVAAAPAQPSVQAPASAPVSHPDLTAAVERLEVRIEEQTRQLARLAERVDAMELAFEAERAERTAPPLAAATPPPAPPVAAPPVAPPPVAAPPVAAPPAPARLFTVQIGSYADAATAQRLAAQAHALGLPVRVTRYEVRGRTVHRVRVGATTTHADAQRVARRLARGYGFPVWVDRVQASEPMPGDAIQLTRRLIAPG